MALGHVGDAPGTHRDEQQNNGKRGRHPPDAAVAAQQQADANHIAPDVEHHHIEAAHRDAVVTQAATDGDRHQHQQRKHGQRQQARQRLEEGLALLVLHGIGDENQYHHAQHAGRHQIAHPAHRQLPGEQDLGGIDVERGHVEQQQGDEQVLRNALGKTGKGADAADVLLGTLGNLAHRQQRRQQHHAEGGYVDEPTVDIHAEEPVERLHKQDDTQREDTAHHDACRDSDKEPLGKVPEGHIVAPAVEAQQEQREHYRHHRGTHAHQLLHREAFKLRQVERHAQPHGKTEHLGNDGREATLEVLGEQLQRHGQQGSRSGKEDEKEVPLLIDGMAIAVDEEHQVTREEHEQQHGHRETPDAMTETLNQHTGGNAFENFHNLGFR